MSEQHPALGRVPGPPPLSRPAFAVGFFFSARSAIVLFFVRVVGAEPRTGASAAIAAELLLFALVGFHSFPAGRRAGNRSSIDSPPARWVLAYLAFACCSLMWSGTVSLAASAAYWCGLAADVAIVLILFDGGAAESVAYSLLKGYIWSSCGLALVAWILPVQADLRLGDPDYFNTNQIANLCAFSLFFAQILMRRRDGRWGWHIFFLAITLVRSLSKTTLAGFLIGQAILLIQDRTMRRRTKVLLTTAAILAVLAFWGLYEAYYDVYTTTGNQAETLTGRTAIWAWSFDAALARPWLGNGFDSMWKVAPPIGPDRFEPRHAENELLQQFYAFGLVGIVLLAGLYGSLFLQFRRYSDKSLKWVFVAMMVFVVIRGLAVAEPFDLLLPLWTIVVVSSLLNRDARLRVPAADRPFAPSPVPSSRAR